jgi:hypothetical protein
MGLYTISMLGMKWLSELVGKALALWPALRRRLGGGLQFFYTMPLR